jgi:hypothetical protein
MPSPVFDGRLGPQDEGAEVVAACSICGAVGGLNVSAATLQARQIGRTSWHG